MNRFDPDVRARIFRVLIGLVGVVALSVAIGLSVGRPFASSEPSAEQATSLPTPSGIVAPTSPPSTPSVVPTSPPPTPTSPPATLAPVDGWLIRTSETFEKPSNWPTRQDQGWASGYQDGRYFLKLDGQQTISYRVPLDSTEFRISTDVSVSEGYAGLVFMADESNDLYRFQVDSAGRYRLARRQGADITALIEWTPAAALKPGTDQTNEIEVWRVEDEITLYANDTKLATYTLPAGANLQPLVGLTLDAVARDKVAEAFFDNLVVRVPVVPHEN